MSFDPYLHFQGTCAEAMTLYADIFGATDLTMMRYSDMPDAPRDQISSDRVLHASFTVAGRVLMASDYPPGEAGNPQTAFSVSHTVRDVAAGQAVFDRLLQHGAAVVPYGPTFWASGFGMVKDRFGTHWMITTPGPA